MQKEEAFSIVDHNDLVLYPVYNKEDLHKSGKFHRAIHLFIEGFGRIFVLQRKAAGTENSGKWSSAVSGHVRHLETYEEAAIRETKEELGLDINHLDLVYMLKLRPDKETNNEFIVLYTYLMDQDKEHIEINNTKDKEIDELIMTPLKDLIVDIDKNANDYSPAFLKLFKSWLMFEKLGGKK